MNCRNFNRKSDLIRHPQMHVHKSDWPLTSHKSALLPDTQIQRHLAVTVGKKYIDHQWNRCFHRRNSWIAETCTPQSQSRRFSGDRCHFIFDDNLHARGNRGSQTGITKIKIPVGPFGTTGKFEIRMDRHEVGCSTPNQPAQGGPLRTKRMRYTADGGALDSSRRIVVSGVAMLMVETVTTELDQASAPLFKAIGVHVTMS